MKQKFYAVARGRSRGIYSTWEQCSSQVTSFPGSIFKSFATLQEARKFLENNPEGKSLPEVMQCPLPSHPLPSATTASKRSRTDEEFLLLDELPRVIPPLAQPKVEGSWTHCWDACKDRRNSQMLREHTACQVTEIYVDGACSSNGQGSAARGGFGGFYGTGDARNFSYALSATEAQTNNRAELRAVIHALEQCLANAGFKGLPTMSVVGGGVKDLPMLRIFSDSRYVIDGLLQYSKKWVRNGFVTSTNTEVKNKDLWERLIYLDGEYRMLFARQRITRAPFSGSAEKHGMEGLQLIHVKGHSKVFGNEMADQLAVDGARRGKELDPPF